jgi:hypothetical protein
MPEALEPLTERYKNMKFSERMRNAIEKLKELQIPEQENNTECSKGSQAIEVEIDRGRHQMTNGTKPDEKKRQQLYRLWKEFVTSTRISEGWYDRMPTLGEGRCRCWKA